MSHTRSALSKIRFCPWCGLDRLKRDSYPMFKAHKHEFVNSIANRFVSVLHYAHLCGM
jgi:hypothetical protein